MWGINNQAVYRIFGLPLDYQERGSGFYVIYLKIFGDKIQVFSARIRAHNFRKVFNNIFEFNPQLKRYKIDSFANVFCCAQTGSNFTELLGLF